MINPLKNTFSVIDGLAGKCYPGSAKKTFGLKGDDGTCIPFVRINPGHSVLTYESIGGQIFMSLYNSAFSFLMGTSSQAITAGATAAGLPVGTLVGAIYAAVMILDQLTGISAKMQADDMSDIIKADFNNLKKHLTTLLECHIDYCTIANYVTQWKYNAEAKWKPVYLDKRTYSDIESQFIPLFIATTQAFNKARLIKKFHVQKVLAVSEIRKEDYEGFFDNYVTPGSMMIRVPNIEWYWMGDKVRIGNNPNIFTITTRAGQIATSDFGKMNKMTKTGGQGVDPRIIGNDGPDKYANGGYNIRNLTGEGWLFTNATKDQFSGTKSGDKISLTQEFINASLPEVPGVSMPAISDTTGTGSSKKELTLKEWSEKVNKAGIFNPEALGNFLFIGIGIYMFYYAIKNYQAKNSDQNNKTAI